MVSRNRKRSAKPVSLPSINKLSGTSSINDEEARRLRAEKRDAIQKERKRKAEILKEEGNQHFLKGQYDLAQLCYIGASQLDENNAVYFCNEAAAELKLGFFREAEANAGFALDLAPRNIKARYRRAMARKALGELKGARADLLEMLKLNPDSADAKLNLLEIEREYGRKGSGVSPSSKGKDKRIDAWSRGDDYYEEGDDFDDDDSEDDDIDSEEDDSTSFQASPGIDSEPESFTSFHSHTSDFEHEGNGIPCSAYNHNGCEKGKTCEFSHAPDYQSLRDDLGKNVCLRFVAGECTSKDKCVYSHVPKYLPARKREGPWTQENAQMEFSFRKKDREFDPAVFNNFEQALAAWKKTGKRHPKRD